MYPLLTKEVIISFLLKFDIDYSVLTTYEQSCVILLSHIFFLLFMFFGFYVMYRALAKIFR